MQYKKILQSLFPILVTAQSQQFYLEPSTRYTVSIKKYITMPNFWRFHTNKFTFQSSKSPAAPLSVVKAAAFSLIFSSVHAAGSSILAAFGPISYEPACKIA